MLLVTEFQNSNLKYLFYFIEWLKRLYRKKNLTETFKKNGYESFVFGQKSYNGVAFLSKSKINNVKNDFIKDKLQQSRIITGEIVLNKKNLTLTNHKPAEKIYLELKDKKHIFQRFQSV